MCLLRFAGGLEALKLADQVKPVQRVAITAGSRGSPT